MHVPNKNVESTIPKPHEGTINPETKLPPPPPPPKKHGVLGKVIAVVLGAGVVCAADLYYIDYAGRNGNYTQYLMLNSLIPHLKIPYTFISKIENHVYFIYKFNYINII